ncbi:MAG: hypothetical protein NTV26_06800 [Caldiserica bacterium]|nr:hypothetical protein [Caldisericota bacterium]
MRKQARSILTGLLVVCCAVAGLVPAMHVLADSSGPAARSIIVTENAGLTSTAYPLAVSAETSSSVNLLSSGPGQAVWTWIQKAVRSTGAWIQKAVRSTGAFFASLYAGMRDFFVSGQALKIVQTATQAIDDFAIRLFLPLSVLVVPILERMAFTLSVTPALVAIWMFWIIVVLALVILIIALRPRRVVRKQLPRVTPRTEGQGENTMEFGLVEQGPKPSPAASLDQLARTHEREEAPLQQEPTSQPAIAEVPAHEQLASRSIPEISLEPLGFFDDTDTMHPAPADTAATVAPVETPLLEFTPPESQPSGSELDLSEPAASATEEPSPSPADFPSEVLLNVPEEASSVEEPLVEAVPESFPEPTLTPIGQEVPVQPTEPETYAPDTVVPLEQPMPSAATPVSEAVSQVEPASAPEELAESQAAPIEGPDTPANDEPLSAEVPLPAAEEAFEVAVGLETVPVETVPVETVPVETVPVEIVPVETVPVETVPVETVPVETVPVELESEAAAPQPPEPSPQPSSADLLSRLLEDEESFDQTMAAAGAAASMTVPVSPSVPRLPGKPAPLQPSVFLGDVELDTLLQDGVVADAGALAELFRGGYRNRISKLAVSAKDLQNVPEEMRQVIKLTVVALSPIELSIARDLAMRLEAPGFVGEALLVTKKMGYENYLTTYKNISKNYKDVIIIETASLKAPEASIESSQELISFS